MAIGINDTESAHGNHRASIHIAAPLELTYSLWLHFERLPDYLHHILEVQIDPAQPNRQHWKTKVFGIEEEWTAEITSLIPNQLITWGSTDGLENSGSLIFEGDSEQTQLTIQIGYNPPLGALGDLAEGLWYKQRFDEGLQEDLTNFKALAEAESRKPKGEASVGTVPLVSGAEPAGYEMSRTPGSNVITTVELKNRLQWGEVAFTLLDVRSADAYSRSHLQGANSAPLEVLEKSILQLTSSMTAPAERALIVYSEHSDGLSAQAAVLLRHLGFDRVLDYTDGFSAAQSAKLPLEFQSMGQIDHKNLPERQDYVERVISGPSVNDSIPSESSEIPPQVIPSSTSGPQI
ncbi:MAG: SRPBCC family protein [Anaerolineae bacterium]|nr:SRPBCC family protein [Gloeobacterales cyanobacterium ES-bin-313]